MIIKTLSSLYFPPNMKLTRLKKTKEKTLFSFFCPGNWAAWKVFERILLLLFLFQDN